MLVVLVTISVTISSPALEYSPNVHSAQYLHTPKLKHELLLFYNIIKAINAAVNLKIYCLVHAQSSTRQYLCDYIIFLPQSYVFTLKLTGSLLKSFKKTPKKIVKSILRCQKTTNSSKIYFREKQLQRMIYTCLELVQITTTTTLTSFPYYRQIISKVFS